MKIVKYIEYLLIILSLIAVGFLTFHRNAMEQSMDKVEFIADYDSFYELSRELDMSMDDMLDTLKDAGFTSIAVAEETLTGLLNHKNIYFGNYYSLKRVYNWDDNIPDTMLSYLSAYGNKFTLIIKTEDQELFSHLERTLHEKYGEQSYRAFPSKMDKEQFLVFDGNYMLRIADDDFPTPAIDKKQSHEKFILLTGMGFDQNILQQVNEHGLKVTLCTNNYLFGDGERQMRYYFTILDNGINYTKGILFRGFSALGYDLFSNQIVDGAAQNLKDRGMHIHLIEADNQLGFDASSGSLALAAQLNHDIVRCYRVPEYILKKYNYLGRLEGAKEIENSIYRAVTDRNIRTVYLTPILRNKGWYRKDITCYKTMIDNLSKRFAPHGISIGEASPMANPASSSYGSKWWYLFVAYGMGALFLLVTKKLYGPKWHLGLFFAMIVVLPLILLKRAALSLSILSFFSVVFFPLVGAFVGLRYMKKLYNSYGSSKTSFFKSCLYAMGGFCLVFGITLLGAFYTASFLSAKTYLLEFSHFRGVKLSLMLPALLSMPLYYMVILHKGTFRDLVRGLQKILRLDVKVYLLIILGMGGLMALIYLLRSGNSNQISMTEELFRNYLENHLIARPRNKEFLVAYPAIFLAFFLAIKGHKKSLLPFFVISMLGFSSVQNSFCHTRTPLRISFYRSVISAGMGIILGFVLLALASILLWAIYKYRKQHKRQDTTLTSDPSVKGEQV